MKYKNEKSHTFTQTQLNAWIAYGRKRYSNNLSPEDIEDAVYMAITESLTNFNKLTEDKKVDFNLIGYSFRAVQGQLWKKTESNFKFQNKYNVTSIDEYTSFDEDDNNIGYELSNPIETDEDLKNAQSELMIESLNILKNNVTPIHYELFKMIIIDNLKYDVISKMTGINSKFIKRSFFDSKNIIKDNLKMSTIKNINVKYGIDRVY